MIIASNWGSSSLEKLTARRGRSKVWHSISTKIHVLIFQSSCFVFHSPVAAFNIVLYATFQYQLSLQTVYSGIKNFSFASVATQVLIFNIAWRRSKIKVITLKSKHEFCRDWNAVVRVVNGTCNFKTLWDWKTSIFLQAQDFLNLAKEVVKKYEIMRLVLFS